MKYQEKEALKPMNKIPTSANAKANFSGLLPKLPRAPPLQTQQLPLSDILVRWALLSKGSFSIRTRKIQLSLNSLRNKCVVQQLSLPSVETRIKIVEHFAAKHFFHQDE